MRIKEKCHAVRVQEARKLSNIINGVLLAMGEGVLMPLITTDDKTIVSKKDTFSVAVTKQAVSPVVFILDDGTETNSIVDAAVYAVERVVDIRRKVTNVAKNPLGFD